MSQSARQLLDSPDFRRLVGRRWAVSLALTAALFAAYYGFILLVALDPALLARRIGAVTTLGIPLGVGVILVAWVLTAVYVVWANRVYDPAVRRLRGSLED
ncbi:MAG TPA: DUF485 domain-containing protein [Thermoanaerobaculia bacterium]|nr:DUF485 domain-containing protein [Thermoanaerobaculia bacterium]